MDSFLWIAPQLYAQQATIVQIETKSNSLIFKSDENKRLRTIYFGKNSNIKRKPNGFLPQANLPMIIRVYAMPFIRRVALEYV
jgi:hypothetical protein